LWDFGDGTTSPLQNPAHIYTSSGTYTVTLIASPPTICNFSDTLIKQDYIVITNTNEPVAAFCSPATLNHCCNYGITKVEFGSIVNTSVSGIDSYQSYTCTNQTTLIAGNPYFIDIHTNPISNENVKVWIDYDNDGDLNDTTELAFESNNKLLYHQGFVNTNANAVLNTPVRMRVTSDQASTSITGSCMQPIRGQTEDYAVIFVPNQLTPVADFILVDPVVLVGSSVQFQDVSLNAPTAWSWFFPGGTPSVSNLQNPSVIYNANGFYSITLIVSNAFGSDSITFTNYFEAMNHVYMCSGTSVIT
jgi:PKD repeat protein